MVWKVIRVFMRKTHLIDLKTMLFISALLRARLPDAPRAKC